MSKKKAMKKVRRKLSRALPCPFCGKIPKFRCHVDELHSSHGSIGHYAVREGCCRPTASGQTELFFCTDFKPANHKLWACMVIRLVDEWNYRVHKNAENEP